MSLRVLVIDDDEDFAVSVVEYLSLDGNQLTDAGVATVREQGRIPEGADVFFGERFE